MQNFWHTATYYFLLIVFKYGKPVFSPFFLWRLTRGSFLASLVNSLCPHCSNMAISSHNELSEHLKNDGRHKVCRIHPPQKDPHLRSELWHIMLNKCTRKTLKKDNPLKHYFSQNNFVPSLKIIRYSQKSSHNSQVLLPSEAAEVEINRSMQAKVVTINRLLR